MAIRLGSYLDCELLLEELDAWGALPREVNGGRPFRLLVLMDEQAVGDPGFERFVASAVDAGARAVHCAGPGSSVGDDWFDEEWVERTVIRRDSRARGDFITTWDEECDSVAQALWEAFFILGSGEDEVGPPRPIVVCALADDDRLDDLRAAAVDLERTFDALLDAEGDQGDSDPDGPAPGPSGGPG